MAQVRKKAKLAHESRQRQTTQKIGGGQFTFQSVVELVEWPQNQQSALVDLDGNETYAIVDRFFVQDDKASGSLVPSSSACPVMYDNVARAVAIQKYADYVATRG